MSGSLATGPATARTDVPVVTVAPGPPVIRRRTVRLLGAATALGAAAWSGSIFVWGAGGELGQSPLTWGITSLMFQLGVMALLHVQYRTRATGTGKIARGFMIAEHVLLGLAILATIQEFFVPALHGTVAAQALDAFWPLSMLGMFGIGIRIAIAGRWTGPARWWPLGAESWAVVCIPAMGLLGPDLSRFVAGGHLLVGYVALGLLLATRPQLTGAR